MNFSDKFLEQADPNNLLNIVMEQGRMIEELRQELLKISRVSGIADELGELDVRGLVVRNENGRVQWKIDGVDGSLATGRDAIKIVEDGLDILNAGYALRLRTQNSVISQIIDSYISQYFEYLQLESFQQEDGGTYGILVDVDFETGDLDGGTATDPSSKISVVQDDDGNYCCEFAGTSDHTTEYVDFDHSVSAGLDHGVFVEIRAYGTGTLWFGETGGSWLYSFYIESDDWRRYVVPIPAVDDMEGLRIGVDASDGAIWIDDIKEYHNYSPNPHARVRISPTRTELDGAIEVNKQQQNCDVIYRDIDGDPILQIDVDTYQLLHYGQPLTTLASHGFAPFAYPLSFNPAAAFTTTLTLPAGGGCIAVPMLVGTRMKLYSVSVANTNTSAVRHWNWALYRQALTSDYELTRVAYANTQAFTPTAASIRTLNAFSATYINPGVYWLVIKNAHSSNSFGLGSTAASAAFNLNTAQTKTFVDVNPPPDPLDFTAATWTKVTAMYAVRLDGVVFGQGTVF